MTRNPILYNDNNVKAIVSVPGWVENLTGGSSAKTTEGAYAAVPLLYRAVMLRAQSIAAVPFFVFDGEDAVDWPFEEDYSELVFMIELALMLKGAAYILKIRDGMDIVRLKWMNPITMNWAWIEESKRKNPETGMVEDVPAHNEYTQEIGDKTYGPWTDDDIISFREPSITSDVGPGLAPAEVALTASKLRLNIDEFAAAFFEHGGQPVTLLTTESKMSDTERDRAEMFFKRTVTGVRNAFRTLFLRAKIDAKVLTPELKSMAMDELTKRSVLDIGAALQVPRSLLESDAANFATSQTDLQMFWDMTVRPRLPMYQRRINKSLFGNIREDYRLEYAPENLAIYQEDEVKRSGALVNLTNAGVGLDQAMLMLGYDPSENAAERDPDDGDQTVTEEERSAPDPMAEELEQWKRFELNRFGKAGIRLFQTTHTPHHVFKLIRARLKRAKTKKEITSAFDVKIQPNDIDAITNKILPEAVAAHLAPVVEESAVIFGNESIGAALEEVGKDGRPFDPQSVQMRKYINDNFGERITAITATTRRELRALILTGIDEGEDFNQMSRRIRTKFKEITRSRARTIATTEVGSAANFAIDEGLRQSGVVAKRRWIATFVNTRDTHAELHGQEVDIGQPFEVDGKQAMRPGGFGVPEEDINCRCTVVAAAFNQ